jgi:hypothetical protein
MPGTIPAVTTEHGGTCRARWSTVSRWRVLVAGVGVLAGVTFATAVWAAVCTKPPPSSSDETMRCNCDTTLGGPDNVWTCTNAYGGAWRCVPSASSPGGYSCAQTAGQRLPGGGRAPGSGGGGSGGSGGGGSVPGKKAPPTTQ